MIAAQTIRRVRAAAVVVWVEAATALVLGIVELLGLDSARLTVGMTTSAFFVVYAVGLALAGRGIARFRTWSRGPVVLAQLIQLGVAWSFHGGSTDWVAVLLVVPALLVLFVVLAPSTTSALYADGSPGDDPPVSSD